MKKTVKLFSVVLLGIISFNARAQLTSGGQKSEQSTQKPAKVFSSEWLVIQKGDNLVNATIGILDFDYVPPFAAVSYERVFHKFNDNLFLGAGATLGLTGVAGAEGSMGVGLYALGNLHFTLLKNWDFYTGLDLGYTFSKYSLLSKLYGGLVYPAHVGASYFFSKNFAATVRFGGWGGVNIGLAAKL